MSNEMTPKQYADTLKSYTGQIAAFEKKIRVLQDEFIKNNREWQENDKLEFTYENGKKDIAYCGRANVHDNGKMYYAFYKAKANGERSAFRYHPDYDIDFIILKLF